MASKVHIRNILNPPVLSLWMVYYDCEKKTILCFSHDLENKKLPIRIIFYYPLNNLRDTRYMYRFSDKFCRSFDINSNRY